MKRIIVIYCFSLLFYSGTLHAQLRAGFKFGVSSVNLSSDIIDLKGVSDLNDLKLNVAKANYGIHAGLFFQLKIFGIFVQPEFILNSTSTDFKLSQLSDSPFDIIKRESYKYLDIPVLVGIKLGPLQLGVGPVGHVFIKSRSELFDVAGYNQKFKELLYGYQASAALVIGKIYFDLRHEGNLSRFGDHIEFHGHQYSFSKSPSRMIGSIGFAF